MSAYRKRFDETKYMSFLIKDNKLLEKYSEIWDKVNNIIKKGFEIQSYEGKINTTFHNYKVPKEDSHCNCLSVILIGLKMGKNIIFKCFQKNVNTLSQKMTRHITEDLEFSSDSDESDKI